MNQESAQTQDLRTRIEMTKRTTTADKQLHLEGQLHETMDFLLLLSERIDKLEHKVTAKIGSE